MRGGGSFASASSLQCLIADTIVKEVSQDDVDSFKATLKNTTVVDSAVRRNLLHRQEVIRKAFICVCAAGDWEFHNPN